MTDNNEQPKKKRTHTLETRRKIAEKRRARTTQPRNATQSTKRMSLYEELKEDYKKNPEALKWLEENKEGLGWSNNAYERIEQAKEMGVQTEYTQMYSRVYEERCSDILFNGTELDVPENDETDPWNHVDFGEDDE